MKLNYKRYGEKGEVIIILHGLLGSLDNWHTIATDLSKDFTVYNLDARNHGKSPHSEIFNYAVMSDDLLEFMNDKHIIKASIIGHSMGGKTAMYFTLHHPEKVSKLVVVDMPPRIFSSQHDEIFAGLNSFPVEKIKNRMQAEELLAERISDSGTRQFLLKNLSRNNKEEYSWKMNLPVIYREYEHINIAVEYPQPYAKPVLFIRGENSDYIRERDVEDIKKLFPDFEIATIKNARHWVQVDNPNDFLQAAFDFLKK